MERLAKERFVIEFVKKIRETNKGIGGLKLWLMYKKEFGDEYAFGRDVFATILSDNNLKVRRKRRRIRTTNSDHDYPKYPDLVKALILDRPSQVWVSDITYIPIGYKKFCFLSIVTDAYTKEIVGYCVGDSLNTKYTLKALDMALYRIKDTTRLDLIHHSDRGVQYACFLYANRLKKMKIKISMTESGDPKDNAIAERVNGILKYEFLNHINFHDIKEVQNVVDTAVSFYNNERPHRSLAMMTPHEAALHPDRIKKTWKSYKESV